MPEAPTTPRHLVGSGWTRRGTPGEPCHWRVVAVSGDEAELRAVLDAALALRLPWRDLRDRARWVPGWR